MEHEASDLKFVFFPPTSSKENSGFFQKMDTNFYCKSVNFIYHCIEVFCFATFLPALTRASPVRLAAEEPAHSFGCAAFWSVKFPVTSGFIHDAVLEPFLC